MALLPLVTLAAPAGAGGLYRWVDDKGQVNYSDRVPPGAAPSGHARLDAQGRVTQEVVVGKPAGGPAPAEDNTEEARARRERVNQDRALLSTYSSVEDIERLRTDRLAPIDAQLRQIEVKREKVSVELEKAETNRKRLTEASKPVPKQLDDNIAEYQRQLAAYQDQMTAHQQRRAQINQKFNQDRARFTELKTELEAAMQGQRRN